jgi:hypothetical protein
MTNTRPHLSSLALSLAAVLSLGGVALAVVCAPSAAATSAAGGTSSGAGVAAALPSVSCRPVRGTETLAKSAHARIFSDARTGDDYGCMYSSGRARFLSTTEHWEYHLVRFSGHYVAFVAFAEDSNAYVGVMNLSTGRVRRFREYDEVASIKPPKGECPSAIPDCSVVCPQVDSLVLKSDGAVAWIGVNFPAPSPTRGASCSTNIAPVTEVRRYDRRGLKLVATGAAIVPSSLRLDGTKLSFIENGHEATSTLL